MSLKLLADEAAWDCLPVQLSTKVELFLNLKSATALGVQRSNFATGPL